MSWLDDYRTALLVVHPDVSADELARELESRGGDFARFIIDHGLGPLWHARTKREEFHQSRMQAEALFLAQEKVLSEVGGLLDDAGIDHVVIKGAANRLLLYDNPALRACFDLDLLVRADDRVTATQALIEKGFAAKPRPENISIELVLSRSDADIDLHWRLLRDGRLQNEDVEGMLNRRRRIDRLWMLDADDALFLLLVHPAYTKHLASHEMGLHRVADIVLWLQAQSFNWEPVLARLEENQVRTAAWATLSWTDLLTRRSSFNPRTNPALDELILKLQPGCVRKAWLDRWLGNNLSERFASVNWVRLLGFSLLLHDNLAAAMGALAGRHRAHQRRDADLAAFHDLSLKERP